MDIKPSVERRDIYAWPGAPALDNEDTRTAIFFPTDRSVRPGGHRTLVGLSRRYRPRDEALPVSERAPRGNPEADRIRSSMRWLVENTRARRLVRTGRAERTAAS